MSPHSCMNVPVVIDELKVFAVEDTPSGVHPAHKRGERHATELNERSRCVESERSQRGHRGHGQQ